MQKSSTLNEKVLTWLAHAGGNTTEMDRQDNQIGYNEAFSWLGCSEVNSRPVLEEAAEDHSGRLLTVSDSDGPRRLGLSKQELHDTAPPEIHTLLNTQQKLLQSFSNFCERKSSIPGLLHNFVLDQWEQPLLFPKPRRAGHGFASSARWPCFLLVIDSPEGEGRTEWKALRKGMNEEDTFNWRFLVPPPRPKNKKERRRGWRAMQMSGQVST